MSVQDYRINAEVRRFLVSRWVDVELIQIGATNGVVYLMGRLDTTLEDPSRRLEEKQHRSPAQRVLQLTVMLEREIRRIRDVRDVVFKLENVYKRGGRWRALDGTVSGTSRTLAQSSRGETANGYFEATGDAARKTWNLPDEGSEGADTETDA